MKRNARVRMTAGLKNLLSGWGGAALMALTLSVQAETFNVDVSDYTLYEDPNYPERQIKLGGFSGLFPVPGDASGTMFYTVTDRGPTQDMITPDAKTHKVLPCYDIAPMIVKVQIQGDGTAQVLEVIHLKKEVEPGVFAPITGWANGVELAPENMQTPNYVQLPYDADALDPEGITMDDNGHFWICEEYRPSIAMIDPEGTVLLRLVPEGCLSGTEIVPTYDILPAVLVRRVSNRGLEGITFVNGCLYTIVQRPLANPTKKVSEASRNLRIVEVNLKAFLEGAPQPAVRQFIYRGDTPDAKVYASDIFALNPALMLVPERKSDRLYLININMASDITPLENADGTLVSDPTKTIEQLETLHLIRLGIRWVKKSVVEWSLINLHPELVKCEGVAVVGRTVVLTYDNDFNLADLGDGSLTPGSIVLKSPDVYPALITAPLPEELVFEE